MQLTKIFSYVLGNQWRRKGEATGAGGCRSEISKKVLFLNELGLIARILNFLRRLNSSKFCSGALPGLPGGVFFHFTCIFCIVTTTISGGGVKSRHSFGATYGNKITARKNLILFTKFPSIFARKFNYLDRIIRLRCR